MPPGEETIFTDSLRLPPEERRAYVERATADNPELRQRVEALLGNYSEADFLEWAADPELRRTRLAPVTEKPGDTIGRYKLLEQIGEGGCGLVYVAEQVEPVRRRVALKIIKLGMDTRRVIARFEAERQALALMDHPNIAKVFDAGATETGRPYFVMELVRGLKITEYCDQAKLSTRARLDLFIEVCKAIQHAHQKGIIHRDIKPSNILVSVDDGRPAPKVIDFGIAKATAGQQLTDKTIYTAFEQFIGTPAYMSPEQAMLTNADVDTRSDIYALGVLLYELLTGKTPFEAKELLAVGLEEMCRAIREHEPPRPSTRLSTLRGQELSTTAQRRGLDAPKLVNELRSDLDWIVMKCLEKDRARRYETANALGADIQRHLNNEPVVARPPSPAYRFRKMVRRNKLAFSAGALMAAALVIGVIVSAWQAKRAKAERDSAEAVLTFFRENILAAGRPEGWDGGLGKDVNLRKAVDAAEPQIAAIFHDRPIIEAAIRHTLGQSYSYLGESHSAIRQKERALGLRQQYLGMDHPDTFESMDTLGFEYVHPSGQFHGTLPKLAKGLSLLENALEWRRRKLGPEAPDTLQTMANLIVAYNQARKPREAISIGEEALRLCKTKLPFEHRTTGELINNLSLAYMHAGKIDKAIALVEEALKTSQERLGDDRPRTLILMHNLARIFAEAGKWDQSVPLCDKVFKAKQAKLGHDHPQTLLSMYWLATGYRETRKTGEALSLFDDLLKRRMATLGPDHADTVLVEKAINETYGKVGKAGPLEAKYRAQLAEQRGDVVSIGLQLGRLLLENAKTNKADFARVREGEQLLQEYLARARLCHTNEPLELGWKLFMVAEGYRERGDYDKAEPLYREQIQRMTAAWGTDDHYYVYAAKENLARLYTDWTWTERNSEPKSGKFRSTIAERAREAERLLRETLGKRLQEHTNSLRIPVVKSELGAALVSVAVTVPGMDAQSRERNLKEGELLLLDAYQQLENTFLKERIKRDALQRIVRLYEAWNKPDERAEWQRKLDLFDEAQQKLRLGTLESLETRMQPE